MHRLLWGFSCCSAVAARCLQVCPFRLQRWDNGSEQPAERCCCEGEEMSLVQCFMNEAVNDKCHSFAPTGWNVQPRSPAGRGRAGFLCCCKGKTEIVECQRDRKTGAHLANLLLIYLSHLFSLDLCKLVFRSITGIYFFPLKNRAIA